jgi:hypothetical protein
MGYDVQADGIQHKQRGEIAYGLEVGSRKGNLLKTEGDVCPEIENGHSGPPWVAESR